MEHHKNVNQKLESFMKRNLLSSEYQRIRCYERCVVDKTMKLALLTSKNLIITDSPPRNILYTLPLLDFLSLTLVQDLPDFLHGDVRFKSQHISIKFRQDTATNAESPLTESTSSYISVSSDGDASAEKSPKSPHKSKKLLSSSITTGSLRSKSWQGTLISPRAHKNGLMKLDTSLDDRVDRLNLSDSGSSASSWSHGSSSQGSPLSSNFAELDLFLLTDTTLFFQLLQAASLNEKIAATKRLNFTVDGGGIKSKRKKSVLRCQLYAQLSSEIRSYASLERRFSLVQELYTAACNDCNIKSYFWKDVDLCKALVDDLGKYRRGTGENNRADEIEYLIQLESCLSEMFRESEHLSQRAALLTASSNTVLRMLLENVCSVPCIPAHLTNDTEVEGLCGELLDSTVTLLFEVLLAAAEHPTYGTDLSVSRVIAILHTLEFDPLYSKIMERGMYLISRTNAAHSTFLLYSIFYVTELLCRNSEVYHRIVRQSHLEDIRYYCSNPELKIVRYSPLQALAIERISRLLEIVS